MHSVLDVLTSTSFIEKALLLIVGGVLTGILVPFVKSRMDRTRFEQEKIFEADLARQSEIVKARAQFLRDFVDPVWQFQLLALQISYDSISQERFDAALANYDNESWLHLKRIRAIAGGARWFTSDYGYKAITEFIDDWLLQKVDLKVTSLRESDDADWHEFNQWLYNESREKTDSLLLLLAKDFCLDAESASPAGPSRTKRRPKHSSH